MFNHPPGCEGCAALRRIEAGDVSHATIFRAVMDPARLASVAIVAALVVLVLAILLAILG